MQGHNINAKHNISELAVFLQEVADMGYDVELTEIDAPIKLFLDEADPFKAQGDFFREYTNACLHTGRCKGVTYWGLNDNFTWYDGLFTDTKPNLPLLTDEEGYIKPAWLGVRNAFETFATEKGDAQNGDTSEAWQLKLRPTTYMLFGFIYFLFTEVVF